VGSYVCIARYLCYELRRYISFYLYLYRGIKSVNQLILSALKCGGQWSLKGLRVFVEMSNAIGDILWRRIRQRFSRKYSRVTQVVRPVDAMLASRDHDLHCDLAPSTATPPFHATPRAGLLELGKLLCASWTADFHARPLRKLKHE